MLIENCEIRIEHCISEKDAEDAKNLSADTKKYLAEKVQANIDETLAKIMGINPLHLSPFDKGHETIFEGEYKVVKEPIGIIKMPSG